MRCLGNKQEMGGHVLNVDGSAISNPKRDGFGRLVRNHQGEFMKGFYGCVGLSTILHTKIQALL